jgi:hypothetical protein
MMKKEYLNHIEEALEERSFEASEIKDILTDYSQMYDDALASGLSEEQVEQKLGDPDSIAKELSFEHRTVHVHRSRKGHKLIALSPFIATIAFFVLGFGFQAWNPGWMVFLIIPVSAIVVDMANKKNRRHMWTPLMPFIAVAAYLLLGFYGDLWHPGWMVFLIIPVAGILESRNRHCLQTLTALSPFISVVAFFILGEFGYWNPGWLVFLSIPMIGILNGKDFWKAFVFELAFLVAIGLYLYIGYSRGAWNLAAASFLIPVVYGVLSGEIKISFGKRDWILSIALIASIAIYIGFGLWLNTWGWLWVVFFATPVLAILRSAGKKNVVVALSPFIAVTIFFLVGWFVPGAWAVSWLAFFLIPIAGILKG